MSLFKRLFGGGGDGSAGDASRWVVVDTETSGLDPENDRLIAIGAVAVDADGVLPGDSFEIVLRGASSGEAANIVVHGIGQEAQRTGVPARDALAAWLDWVAGAPRVGFHTDFDRVVLGRAGPKRVSLRRAQPRRLARGIRHRVLHTAQCCCGCARYGRIAAAAARPCGQAGDARIRGAGQGGEAAEVARRQRLTVTPAGGARPGCKA
jgi:DNA polymerase III epsilon subunit-like protein